MNLKLNTYSFSIFVFEDHWAAAVSLARIFAGFSCANHSVSDAVGEVFDSAGEMANMWNFDFLQNVGQNSTTRLKEINLKFPI